MTTPAATGTPIDAPPPPGPRDLAADYRRRAGQLRKMISQAGRADELDEAAGAIEELCDELDAILRHCTVEHGTYWFAFTSPSAESWTACASEAAAIEAVRRAATERARAWAAMREGTR